MTGMVLKKEPQKFIYHYIKALSGEMGYTHIEAVGLTGDNVTSIKCMLASQLPAEAETTTSQYTCIKAVALLVPFS